MSVLGNATPILADSGEVESFIVILQDLASMENLQRQRAEFPRKKPKPCMSRTRSITALC